MNDNTLIAFIIGTMMLSSIIGLYLGEHQAEECKLKAIEHNVPVLEIKGLCK